ncbi:MAG: methylenetetrahydrofolate reductase [Thermoplasmata archaeon]
MNDILERLNKEEFPMTYEVPSPRGGNVEDYVKKISRYEFLDRISAINVCNNPVGKVRIDPAPYAYFLKDKLGIETIAHLTCRDATLSGLQKWLLGADSLGIRNILAMTGDLAVGDYPAEDKPESINSLELITGIKDHLNKGKLMPELSTRQSRLRNRYLTDLEELERPTNFTVGGVMLPHRNQEYRYAAKKITAGVDFFQTQITYDSKEVISIIEDIENTAERHPPVLVSTAPFSSPDEMKFLSDTVPQVNIPDSVQSRLMDAKDFSAESIKFVRDMYQDIKEGVKERGLKTKIGAHIIPMRSEEMVAGIIRGMK